MTAFLVTTCPAIAGAPDGGISQPAPASNSKPTASLTLESRNKTLADARLRQSLAPTLENERHLAEEYASAGVLDAAFDHFEAALRLDPHDVPSLDGTARIWRDWGAAHRGLPHAYRAVYWAPESAEVQNTLGTLLLKLREFDGARARFELALRLDPGAGYALNNLCYLELQRGAGAEATHLCREAAAADANSDTARNNLAMALASAGDLEGAMLALEAARSPAIAAYNQGILLQAAGQLARARDAFSRARIADPAFLPALTRLRKLAASSGGL